MVSDEAVSIQITFKQCLAATEATQKLFQTQAGLLEHAVFVVLIKKKQDILATLWTFSYKF